MCMSCVRSLRHRQLLNSHTYLAREFGALRKSVATLDAATRRQFDVVYDAILGLMNPATKRQ